VKTTTDVTSTIKIAKGKTADFITLHLTVSSNIMTESIDQSIGQLIYSAANQVVVVHDRLRWYLWSDPSYSTCHYIVLLASPTVHAWIDLITNPVSNTTIPANYILYASVQHHEALVSYLDSFRDLRDWIPAAPTSYHIEST